MDDAIEPTNPRQHPTDAYATKLVDAADKFAAKKAAAKKQVGHGHGDDDKDKDKKEPAGGYDATSVVQRPPGYTVVFTFHRASELPFADVNTMSADPYVKATLQTSLPLRHKQDPLLELRTPTVRRNINPEWNTSWVVGNVPADGFRLKARLYDEDPGDHDDRLGNVHVNVESLTEDWPGIDEQVFDIQKRSGSKRAYLLRGCAALFSGHVHLGGKMVISARVLGRTHAESGGRLYTIGPCAWSKHYSPLFGRITGTKDPQNEDGDGKGTQRYNFQANQMQLAGPVPEHLYHRYVEFKPFVAGMFESHSLRGRLLNHALHHQHARIYNYDRTTVYGSFPQPSLDFTRQFLDLVHYDEGGRIFTYVITLDGQWRFTETGKQFGIDLLSKHTMHSDVSIYIAFSGEFFVRRLKNPHRDPSAGEKTEEHPPAEIEGGPPKEDAPRDPAYYHLTIDNDSGTYRPNKDMLGQLKEYLRRNLPGLKISTLDCQGDAEKMNKMKDEQRERHKAEGQQHVYLQADDSSISSSDEEDLADLEGAGGAAAGASHGDSRKAKKIAHLKAKMDRHHAEGGDAEKSDAPNHASANDAVPNSVAPSDAHPNATAPSKSAPLSKATTASESQSQSRSQGCERDATAKESGTQANGPTPTKSGPRSESGLRSESSNGHSSSAELAANEQRRTEESLGADSGLAASKGGIGNSVLKDEDEKQDAEEKDRQRTQTGDGKLANGSG